MTDASSIDRLEKLADWLDSKFILPGTNIKFGVDSILGLLPGIGDTLSLGISAYIYKHAHDLNLPYNMRARMLWNIFIDWLIGLIPLLGDLFDIGFKANRRNVALLRQHVNSRHIH